jgi:hypothetical protein
MSIKRRKAPYADTEVPIEKSTAEINKLLRDYGCEGVSWSQDFAHDRLALQFVLRDDSGHAISVQVEPAPFAVERRNWNKEKGRYELVKEPNWPQSLRLLKNWVKVKLESVAFGLREMEQEFLSDVLVQTQGGETTTVGKLIGRQVAEGKYRPSLPMPESPAADYRTVD